MMGLFYFKTKILHIQGLKVAIPTRGLCLIYKKFLERVYYLLGSPTMLFLWMIKNEFSCAEPMACLLYLRSSTEDSQLESVQDICLRPGTSDYHDL